jgi:hypothetical protein
MNEKILQNSIRIIKNFMSEEGMVVGTGGFTGSSDPKGPVAGFDPPIKLDRRTKIMKRLPIEYFNSLKKKKEKG